MERATDSRELTPGGGNLRLALGLRKQAGFPTLPVRGLHFFK